MNLLYLAWRNLRYDHLKSLLSILLMSLGLGLICFFMVFSGQVEKNFRDNLAGVHLVLGAKGSPLQLVLCNLYHADVPTGNITIKEAQAFLNPKHPLLSHAVPLSLGDSYRGFRLVGTTEDFLELYELELARGVIFEKDLQVLLGAEVARKTGMEPGDKFKSSHGLGIEEALAESHEQSFTVAGILKESGTVADELILCSPSSFWLVHDHGDGHNHGNGHEHDEGHEHGDGHNHNDGHEQGEGHDHGEGHGHEHDHDKAYPSVLTKSQLLEYPDKEITSLLLRFRSKNVRSLNMMRSINENTPLMAASPSFELNKLFDQLGIGFDLLNSVALLILFISALSIWFGMSIALQERKYELALIRSIGGQPWEVVVLLLLEALLIAVIGFVVGMFVFYGLMWLSNEYWSADWGFGRMEIRTYTEQGLVLILGLAVAVLSVVVPIVQVLRMDIARTLSER